MTLQAISCWEVHGLHFLYRRMWILWISHQSIVKSDSLQLFAWMLPWLYQISRTFLVAIAEVLLELSYMSALVCNHFASLLLRPHWKDSFWLASMPCQTLLHDQESRQQESQPPVPSSPFVTLSPVSKNLTYQWLLLAMLIQPTPVNCAQITQSLPQHSSSAKVIANPRCHDRGQFLCSSPGRKNCKE